MARSLTPDSLEVILNAVMKQANENSNLLTKQLSEHMTNAIGQMNTNMNKMLEAFSTTIQVMMSQITKTLTDALNEMTKTFLSRMETLEQSFITRAPSVDLAEIKNVLWNVEKERVEKSKRSTNVIVSGLPAQPSLDDSKLVHNFIEQNLTVKPAITNIRRFGRDPTNTKLCLTLSNSEAVRDLISSSRILRISQDAAVRKVFMNYDLTPSEAEAAYQKRCQRRLKTAQSGSTKASAVQTQSTSQPFRK